MRAANMQSLTNDMQKKYPGMTIYGIGDTAHKLETSDHNEDDTPGSRSEQTDADNVPEHRAIDCMLTAGFTTLEAEALVARMVADKATTDRLHYIIWSHHIWSASHGWTKLDYDGSDPHTNHVHVSGLAADDENTASWPIVFATSSAPTPPQPQPTPPSTKTVWRKGDVDGDGTVRHIQQFFHDVFPAYRSSVTYRVNQMIDVDGAYGDQTVAWVKEFQKRTGLVRDGETGPKTLAKMRQYGYRY